MARRGDGLISADLWRRNCAEAISLIGDKVDGTTPGTITVTDEAFGGSWDGSLQVPTKNAVYDQFAALFITWGTYTPTVTAVANMNSQSASGFQYYRVGVMCTASGYVNVNPAVTATLTQLGISLPIPSNFSAIQQLGGTAAANGGSGSTPAAGIFADATNKRATLSFLSTLTASYTLHCHFTYQII